MSQSARPARFTPFLRAATIAVVAVALLPATPASGLSNLTTVKTADQSAATAGNSVGYTFRVTNPNGADVTLTDIWDLLPSGFTYRADYSTYNFSPTPNPDQSVDGATGRTLLTFRPLPSNPFLVPAGLTRILHFSAFVSPVNGSYSNRAGGNASGVGVTSTGDTASVTVTGGTTADTMPPAQVTSFTATPGDGSVLLSWTNPADADFSGARILYSSSATTPTSSTDGSKTAVDVGNVTSKTVTGLTNGVTYHFWAFTYDSHANVNNTSPPHAQATPQAPDSTPPAQVTNFVATAGDSQVVLTWTMPTDVDLASVTIFYSTSSTPPTSVSDGAFTSVTVDNSTGTTITGLTNGVTYHFWAFARDTSNNVNNADPPHAQATPAAPTCEPAEEPLAEAWDNRFAKPGLTSSVFAMAANGTDVYVAHSQDTLAGLQPGNRIARWDGHHWSALGEGVDGPVRAIAVSGGKVYVGGEFTHVGCGIPANHVAMWDPETRVWSALGGGVSQSVPGTSCSLDVWALTPTTDGGVVAGGCFDHAGGATAFGIARWMPATSTWSPLGDGVRATIGGGTSGVVRALLAVGDVLHVGGQFASAGGVGVHSYATWNGTWAAHGSLSTGPFSPGRVNALAVDPDGHIYVGGQFTSAGGVAAVNVAMLDGATWSALGTGVSNGSDNVRALAWHEGALWTGGDFQYANGIAIPNLAAWDGYGWSQVRLAPDGPVAALLSVGGDLYAGGGFWHIGVRTFDSIARWDSRDWQTIGQGDVNGTVRDIQRAPNGDVYVAGTFTVPAQVGHTVARGVVRWTGSDWQPLGAGLEDFAAAYTIAIDGDDVYVGGIFGHAGETAVSNIARWDGTSWSALGPGLSAAVRTLTVHDGYLYAGGDFNRSGDGAQILKYAARWNLATGGWSPLSATQSLNATVYSFLPLGGTVVIGGDFSFINTDGSPIEAPGLATYDLATQTLRQAGSVLQSQPGDVYIAGTVRATAAIGNEVYVAGNFDTAGGGVPGESSKISGVGNIASFHIDANDTIQWSAVGSGVAGSGATIRSLSSHGGDLFVGGDFTSAGGVAMSRVARWSATGSAWSALGSGVTDANPGDVDVYAVRADAEGVLTGGSFHQAGTRLAADFDIYRFTPAALITAGPPDEGYSTGSVSFQFTATGPVADYTCTLDGAAAPCTSPQEYLGLTAGRHRFTVTATSGTGFATASRGWWVTTPPTAVITGKRGDYAKTATAWHFTADHARAEFRCTIDNSPYAWCASPTAYAPLAAGPHTFCVQALDLSGVGPQTCDTRTVSAPPTVAITSGPATGSTTSAAVSFGLMSDHAGAGFECSLDGAAYTTCSSPKSYSGLSSATHTFAVRAVDGSGTSAPATRSWTVSTPFAAGTYVAYQWAGASAFPGGRLVRVAVTSTGGMSVLRTIAGSSSVTYLPEAATDRYVVGVRRITGQSAVDAVVFEPTSTASIVRTLSTSGKVPFTPGGVTISRDSRAVYFVDGTVIRKVPPTGGTPVGLLSAPAGMVFTGVASSATGSTLYYGLKSSTSSAASVWRYLPATQTSALVLSAPTSFWPGSMAVSPDGRTLAIGWIGSTPGESTVRLTPIASGGFSRSLAVADTPGNVSWRDDGTTLTVDSRSTNAWTRFNPSTGGSQRFTTANTSTARSFPVDVTRVVRVRAPSVFTVGTSTPVTWTGSWPGQTIADYDVRYRSGVSALSGFIAPTSWQHVRGTTLSASGLMSGRRYCYSVRARTTAGALSLWSDEVCTTVPHDDTALTASSPPWTRRTGATGFWQGTYLSTSTLGASARTGSHHFRQVMLIATTCSTCGSVDVYWGGTFWKSVSLYSATTVTSRRLSLGSLPLAASTWFYGTFTVKVRTSGKLVRLDGIGLSP